jgi:pSer/pThr/pTyr-binding forkhead associated (FHA) protein
MPRLVARSGELEGQAFALDSPITIGSDRTCQIHSRDPVFSWHHARVSLEDGIVWVEDLESSEGTRINGRLIDRAPLRVNDTMSIGDTRFSLAADGDAESHSTAGQKEVFRPASEQIRALKATVREAELSETRLKGELQAIQTRQEELERRYRAAIEERDRLKSDLENTRGLVESLRSEIETLKKENGELVVTIQEETQKAESALASFREEKADLIRERDSERTNAREMARALDELRASTQRQVEEARAAAKEKEEEAQAKALIEVENLRRQRDDELERLKQSMGSENARIQKERQALIEERDRLHDRVRELMASEHGLTNRQREAEENNRRLEGKLKKVGEEAARARADHQERLREIQDLFDRRYREISDQLGKERSEWDVERQARSTQLDNLRGEVTKLEQEVEVSRALAEERAEQVAQEKASSEQQLQLSQQSFEREKESHADQLRAYASENRRKVLAVKEKARQEKEGREECIQQELATLREYISELKARLVGKEKKIREDQESFVSRVAEYTTELLKREEK